MPKKRAPKYDIKPKVPTHPSLSSDKPRSASHSLTTHATPTGNSVNDQIQKLRLSEQPSNGSRFVLETLNPNSSPSLPPSLRNILQIPDAPPPRPRPGLRVTGGRRVPAGPAAPQSWARANQNRSLQRAKMTAVASSGVITSIEPLPGAYVPEDGSLLAMSLKALARDWDWHREYDQYYLAIIPVRYKEALLHYIAVHSEYGIDRAGLELLFLNEHDLEDATGTEGLTYLDLSISICHPLKFSELKAFLGTKRQRDDTGSDSPPESWDAEVSSTHITPSSALRSSTLTHLSLSYPSPKATAPWRGLLALLPETPTLTHLSLAHWPTPTLTPNSKTAYTSTPSGSVQYGATGFYDHKIDLDWTEATSLLRRLCKTTYCLQWLDVSGCWPWPLALRVLEAGCWQKAWRGLEVVKIKQGPLVDWLAKGLGVEDKQQEVNLANVARSLLFLEADINEEIKKGGMHARERPSIPPHEEEQYWHHEIAATSPTAPLVQEGRKTKVVFDRGWYARSLPQQYQVLVSERELGVL